MFTPLQEEEGKLIMSLKIYISLVFYQKYFFVSVIPIWKEPLPGWTDNINGPTGLLIGAGKGVIRTMYCNNEGYADYLPVDIAVNGLLIGTWNYVMNKYVIIIIAFTCLS